MRFTHANRHCPDHPFATLTRSDDFVLKPVSENTEFPPDVTRWLERYKMLREKEDRTPTGKSDRKKKQWKTCNDTHKRIKSRKGLVMDAVVEQENLDRTPQTPNRLYCSESQDSQDDSQDEDPAESCAVLHNSEDEEATGIKLPLTPLRRPRSNGGLDRMQPKKRWLRAVVEQQQLAKPLRWDLHPTTNYHRISDELNSSSQWCLSESTLPGLLSGIGPRKDDFVPLKTDHSEQLEDSQLPTPKIDSEHQDPASKPPYTENETRPTVLMLAGKNQSPKSPPAPPPPTPTPPSGSINEIGNADVKVIVVKQEESTMKVSMPEDNQKWLGALALMELAKVQEEAARALRLNRDLDTHTSPNYIHL